MLSPSCFRFVFVLSLCLWLLIADSCHMTDKATRNMRGERLQSYLALRL
jgi:hypothetical protein